ncbi:MAG: hypothetical protein FJY97_00610 [candidate division Zixibacteria bacterium]|nr:hypothetical protein [candidate division Zixibacteria bacterium]
MKDHAGTKSFRLARMCPLIRTLTLLLLALPLAFLVASLFGAVSLVTVALILVAIYTWIWLRFRPGEFIVRGDVLEVRWPLKHRTISLEDISEVRVVDREQLKTETGWDVRVGAGGLWGGFGWLWTKRRGIFQMYVSPPMIMCG